MGMSISISTELGVGGVETFGIEWGEPIPTTKVIFIGDSIMLGNSPTYEGMQDYITATAKVKASQGGATLIDGGFAATQYINTQLVNAIAANPDATAVVCNGGVNDIGRVAPGSGGGDAPPTVDEMLAELSALVDLAHEAEMYFVYIPILPYEDASSWNDFKQTQIDEFNSEAAKMLNMKRAAYVDAYSAVQDLALTGEDKKVTSPNDFNGDSGTDFVHMSAFGCQAVADVVDPFMLNPQPDADTTAADSVVSRMGGDARYQRAIRSFVHRQERLGNWEGQVDEV